MLLAVLMYVKYPLGLRNAEDLLAEREIDISYETVRHWWGRFVRLFAAGIPGRCGGHLEAGRAARPSVRRRRDEAGRVRQCRAGEVCEPS